MSSLNDKQPARSLTSEDIPDGQADRTLSSNEQQHARFLQALFMWLTENFEQSSIDFKTISQLYGEGATDEAMTFHYQMIKVDTEKMRANLRKTLNHSFDRGSPRARKAPTTKVFAVRTRRGGITKPTGSKTSDKIDRAAIRAFEALNLGSSPERRFSAFDSPKQETFSLAIENSPMDIDSGLKERFGHTRPQHAPLLQYSTSRLSTGASFYDGDTELDPHHSTIKRGEDGEEATSTYQVDAMTLEDAIHGGNISTQGIQDGSIGKRKRVAH